LSIYIALTYYNYLEICDPEVFKCFRWSKKMDEEAEEQETYMIKPGVPDFQICSIISSASRPQKLTRQIILYLYQRENC
jgi:hypothetical protein